MRVYVAGSMKNIKVIRELGELMRQQRLNVYVFCDEDQLTYEYSLTLRQQYDISQLTPQAILYNPILRSIGVLNLAQLKLCDACVIVLPSGRSAHMEGGFMCGRGKPLYIIGPMEEGEFDAMYLMAQNVYTLDDVHILIKDLKNEEKKNIAHDTTKSAT